MTRQAVERGRRIALAAGSVPVLVAVFCATASAHVERPAYWPDPAPDCSVKPCTGGEVPEARRLFTALDKSKAGSTHVVCRPGSMHRVRAAVARAESKGYKLRPSQPAIRLSKKRGRRLIAFNRKLAQRCHTGSIQDA